MTRTASDETSTRIDIVSDVVCPWCIIGFKQLERALGSERVVLDHEGGDSDDKFGTVGAVALDHQGELAAGTSSGGPRTGAASSACA